MGIYYITNNAIRGKIGLMKHKKIYYILLAAIIIIALSFVGHKFYEKIDRHRALSHNELVGYINKYCLDNEDKNLKIELEKDVDNLHVVLLSYNDINSNQSYCLVVFDKLADSKYKYNIYEQQESNINMMSALNDQGKDSKNYGFIYGIITGDDANKFSAKIGDKTFTEVVEKNKFFIKVYDMGNDSRMSIATINDKQ